MITAGLIRGRRPGRPAGDPVWVVEPVLICEPLAE
jgi:hypothetical protein